MVSNMNSDIDELFAPSSPRSPLRWPPLPTTVLLFRSPHILVCFCPTAANRPIDSLKLPTSESAVEHHAYFQENEIFGSTGSTPRLFSLGHSWIVQAVGRSLRVEY